MELMLPKGMHDLDPEDALLQNQILDLLRNVFERYGYVPIETPLVERMDILTAKFAAGEGTDVSKEIFHVKDQGDRDLGLRFDMTVPLARYIAMHPTIKLPFKRYAIGKVFRDGPIKLGRYREFWQADADIVGVPGPMADAEGVIMASDVFQQLGLDIKIACSSRELLHELMEVLDIPDELRNAAIVALDKLKKIGKKGVLKEMKNTHMPDKKAQQLLSLTEQTGTNEEKICILSRTLKRSRALPRLETILNLLKDIPDLSFDPSLARGLSYYTGFFFECILKQSAITSSLVGTGRYDTMIGQYLGGKKEFPAVGISFGVSVITDALKEKKIQTRKILTNVYVVPVTEHERSSALDLVSRLRKAHINTDMDLLGRSLGKNFTYANALGIPIVIVIGEEEVKTNTYTVKNMKTGEQKRIDLNGVIAML